MLTTLIILALANAAIVTTFTQASLFEKFREWLPGIYLRKLFHCPYCLAHYSSVLLILFSFPFFPLFDFVIQAAALTTATSLFAFLLTLYLNTLESK